MSASMDWGRALQDLTKDILALPPALRAELKPQMVRRGQNILSRTQSEYSARGFGSVGRNLRLDVGNGDADLSVRVRNSHPLAHLIEWGSADRFTTTGARRGRMPGANIFVPIVEQERAGVVGDLSEALRAMQAGSTLQVR